MTIEPGKKAQWEVIICKLEKGEISEERAQEELMRIYGVSEVERVNPCN
ncbi:MAG: hypothetical protein PHW58_05875 [Candidatus Methanofastidiosa archaeon]|jgi:hypothetical protein|nr:hypothetical protein [Candidatus Methanofastidiosa archaeon]